MHDASMRTSVPLLAGLTLALALILGCQGENDRGTDKGSSAAVEETLAAKESGVEALDPGVSAGRRPAPNPGPGRSGLEEAEEQEVMDGFSTELRAAAKKVEGKRTVAKSWKRSRLAANTSRLMIGDKEELPLKGMQFKVDVDGFRARVLIDFYFLNDRDRQYEGTFQLRLPNDASPYFFAFGETEIATKQVVIGESFFTAEEARRLGMQPAEIMDDRQHKWTKPKEARMVPRRRAARAYTETVRKRTDPALMEWSGAGVFSARVFPLAPKKYHRIVIGYDVDLLAVGDALEYRLDMPGNVPSRVIDVSIADSEGLGVQTTPEAEAQRADGRLCYRFDDPPASVRLRLTGARDDWLTGKDAATGDYFATRITPELDANAGGTPVSRGVFLVDTSMSSNPERFNVWLQLLEATLDENRDVMREFAVCFFDIECHWWRDGFVPNDADNVKALLAYARSLALEGGTDLGAALRAATREDWQTGSASPYDVFLLSDGATSWGENDADLFAQMLRGNHVHGLYAYVTGIAGTATGTLQKLARATAGAVFSVVGEHEVGKAAKAHRRQPYVIRNIAVDGCSDLRVAGRPSTIYPGQTLLVTGRGRPKPGAELVLSLEQNGKPVEVRQRAGDVIQSELAPRIYGQVAVAQLEEFKDAALDLSKAYATHFRVVGATCSLLMLESEGDYRQYGIKPEEDAYVVKNRAVTPWIDDNRKRVRATLESPKASFFATLRRLAHTPGVEFEIPAPLRAALEAMPEESFSVVARPLVCKSRTWDAVPGSIQEMLASRKLDYDAFVADADNRARELGQADALKTLSSLLENRPGDVVLARDLGFKAMEYGLGGHAFFLFRRVEEIRAYEPQTWRAMAHCLAEIGKTDLALACYEVGLAANWDARFGEFHLILATDYLRFLDRIRAGTLKSSVSDYARMRRTTVAKSLGEGDSDLVVQITWNTDRTDVDLHVIEPTGEECYYSHRDTKIGGHLSTDVTQGYGPEMYTLRRAMPGLYRIRAKYFASDRNRATTSTKIYATIYERFGTPQEKVTKKVIALTTGKEMHDIAEIRVAR